MDTNLKKEVRRIVLMGRFAVLTEVKIWALATFVAAACDRPIAAIAGDIWMNRLNG